MNIFFLSENHKDCAIQHTDKHVVKMRIELAQLACTTHHLTGTDPEKIPYRPTHYNHPSAIWTRSDIHNYIYVVELALALCDELRHRFNTKVQKVESVLWWCLDNCPNIQAEQFTPPLLAMPEEFKVLPCNTVENALQSYRNYYKHGKIHLHKWTNRNKPNWI
jgi:hypothetical protein